MTDDIHWGSYDQLQRNAARTRNSLAGVTLNLPNDSGPVQSFQTEAHVGELRNSQPRVENHGFSSLPLPGAKGVAIYLNGNRGSGIIIATVDARYRPTGLKPGEMQAYMIDSAKADGSGGTTRTVLKATLGWVLSLFGKTMNVGDSNTTTITITGTSVKIVGDLEVTGKLKIDGATTVQDINIQGTETGGGST
jgi:phage baseplate assembly protein V